MKSNTCKYKKKFYELVILNLELDFEFGPFPGMRQALRALEVGTPEVPSRFLEIKKSEEFACKLQIHHRPRMMIAILEQVRKYLLEEVNIVYECKVCMNFFR